MLKRTIVAVTLVCGLFFAVTASSAGASVLGPAAYDRVQKVYSPYTGKYLGQAAFSKPSCTDYGYGSLLGGWRQCRYGDADVVENVSDSVTVYRYTYGEYRTWSQTSTGQWVATGWSPVQGVSTTWSTTRCDQSPYSLCGNNASKSLCTSGNAWTFCYSGQGLGQTVWMNGSQFACGQFADSWTATLGCSVPVNLAPHEELRATTRVYFYEKQYNIWWYTEYVRQAS